jgi:steroid 5-alpha reductase family enzyme
MAKLLLVNALLLFIYMTLWFAAAHARRRLDTVDTAWSLGFVVVAWSVASQQASQRTLVIAILVSIWGLRLANHIWRRSRKHGEDPRYEELSGKWRGNFWLRAYLSIFLLQGVLIWLISLPIVVAGNRQLSGLGWLSVAGGMIWLIGFIIEAVADRQLRLLLGRKNHPKVLQTGLWRYSRHPNYFGELTQWWGIGVIALQASYGWIGLAGPLLLSVLIIFVSGIPPIEKRRLKQPDYQAYKARTSALIPLPPRR